VECEVVFIVFISQKVKVWQNQVWESVIFYINWFSIGILI